MGGIGMMGGVGRMGLMGKMGYLVGFQAFFSANRQMAGFVAIRCVSKKAHRTHVESTQKGGLWWAWNARTKGEGAAMILQHTEQERGWCGARKKKKKPPTKKRETAA